MKKLIHLFPLASFPRMIAFAMLFLWSGCFAAKCHAQVRPVIDPYRYAVSGFASDCGTLPVTRGLIQWLCPAQFENAGVPNGISITNWLDSGPTGLNSMEYVITYTDASLFHGPTYITNGHNGKPRLYFGNPTAPTLSPIRLTNAWFSGVTEAEIVMVAWFHTLVSDSYGPFSMGPNNLSDQIYNFSGDSSSSFGSTTLKSMGNIGLRTTNIFRLNLTTKANDWNAYTNGVLAYHTAVNTVGWPSVATNAFYSVVYPGNLQFIGNVYEFIAFTNVLTAPERAAVDNWIKSKYGL